MGAWTGKCSNTILEILRVQASLHNEAVPAFSLERPIFFSRADTFFPCLPYPAIVDPLGRPDRRLADPPQWYDDAVPLREGLRARRLPLALVANTIFGLGQPWEDRFAPYLPTRVLSREFGFVKPHPGIFLEAARRLDANPKDCLFVGDLPLADVWGAQQGGGMRAVLVDRGDDEESTFRANDARMAANLGVNLSRIEPTHTVSSLRDVLPLVD